MSPITTASSLGAGDAAKDAGNSGGDGGSAFEALAIYESDAMREHMHVFSKGMRACPGKPIALMELKLVMAAIVQRFATLRLADARQTVEDMRQLDDWLLVPKGKRCGLVFE